METRVNQFFKQYAEALASFSAEKIASFYSTPMAVYSDQGVLTVSKMDEVVSFWEKGVQPYASQNIKKAVPEIFGEEQLAKTVHTCHVLWKNYDNNGKEVANETNFYILSETNTGLKITGLIIMQES